MIKSSMKKILILLIIVFMTTASLFAGGSSDKKGSSTGGSADNTASAYEIAANIKPATTAGSFMESVANVYDEITMAFCLGMTPFPNTLVQFYGGYGQSGYDLKAMSDGGFTDFNLGNSLLIGNTYYNKNGGKLDYGSKTYVGKSSETQKSIWNMITVLFLSFLLAEIVFTAIYHYVSDKDGSALKEILAKAVMSMAIFLVAASLPFLIEVFRIGFTSAAYMLTGMNDLVSGDGIMIDPPANIEDVPVKATRISTKSLKTLQEMQRYPVFMYPGTLIRSLSDIMGFLNPDNVGGSGVDLSEEVQLKGIKGVILDALIEVIYFIVKMMGTIMVLVAALHVMYNVCEVYLLLGCVMLLLPFTIFSPLKFLGEKAVMSLFSNVLELFVIIMIMFTTVAIASTVTSGLLSMILSSVKSITVTMHISNPQAFAEGGGDRELSFTKHQQEDIVELAGENGSLDFKVMLPGPTSAEDGGSYQDVFQDLVDQSGEDFSMGGVSAQTFQWFQARWSEFLNSNLAFTLDLTGVPYCEVLTPNLKFSYDNAGYDPDKYLDFLKRNRTIMAYPASDKVKILNYIANSYGTEFGMTIDVEGAEAEMGVDPNTNPFDIYFMHIVSFFLVIMMETYFINQSSQITNALLSGNVSSEGFSGMLTRMAGGMALKAATKGASTVVKGAGGLGKALFAARAAKTGSALDRFLAGEKPADIARDIRNKRESGNP